MQIYKIVVPEGDVIIDVTEMLTEKTLFFEKHRPKTFLRGFSLYHLEQIFKQNNQMTIKQLLNKFEQRMPYILSGKLHLSIEDGDMIELETMNLDSIITNLMIESSIYPLLTGTNISSIILNDIFRNKHRIRDRFYARYVYNLADRNEAKSIASHLELISTQKSRIRNFRLDMSPYMDFIIYETWFKNEDDAMMFQMKNNFIPMSSSVMSFSDSVEQLRGIFGTIDELIDLSLSGKKIGD